MELEYHDISPADINAESKNLTNERACCFFSAVTHFLFYIVELREFLIENKHKFENNILLNLIALFELLKNPGTPEKVAPQTGLYDKSIYDLYSSIQKELFTDRYQKTYDNTIAGINEKQVKWNAETVHTTSEPNWAEKFTDASTALATANGGLQRDAEELLNQLFNLLDLEISKCLLIPNESTSQKTPIKYLIKELCLDIPFYDLYHKSENYGICNDDPDPANPKLVFHKSTYEILNHFSIYEQHDIEIIETEGRPTTLRNPSITYNINLLDIRDTVQRASDNHDSCKYEADKRTLKTIPNTTFIDKFTFNKYIIINIKRFSKTHNTVEPHELLLSHLQNGVSGINKNIILDRSNNKYKLVGAICHTGNLNSGHYWYKKLNNTTNLFDNYDDTFPNLLHPQIIERNVPLDPTEVTVLIFRKMDEPYRIPYLDENKINRVILTNLKLYKLDETKDNFDKIKEYINLLVFYTNIYNSNYYLEFHELLCDVYDHLCCQIEYLLVSYDVKLSDKISYYSEALVYVSDKYNKDEYKDQSLTALHEYTRAKIEKIFLCDKISYNLKALVYLSNKYNICGYNNQLLIDFHEYINCEIEKLIELI
jgi:hypothetical protein